MGFKTRLSHHDTGQWAHKPEEAQANDQRPVQHSSFVHGFEGTKQELLAHPTANQC